MAQLALDFRRVMRRRTWRKLLLGRLLPAALALLLVGLFWTPPVEAGDPSFGRTRLFGPGDDRTTALAAGDLNGDGALDVVAGNYDPPDGQQNVAYLNDGTGNLDWPGAGRDIGDGADWTTALLLGDVDGDGHLDVVVGNNGQNIAYLNDGAAHFYTGTVDCGSPPPNARCFGTGTDATTVLSLGDVDGDGDLDIAVGNDGEPNMVYLNDGSGNFPASLPFGTGLDVTDALALGDADGDGDLDLAVGDFLGQNVLYLNDGAGNLATPRPFGTGADHTKSVAWGDVDGDGDLDLAVGNANAVAPGPGQQNVVYLNDGAGNLGTARNFGSGDDWSQAVGMGDVDGDGDLDLAVGNSDPGSGEQNAVYLNDGSGTFDTPCAVGPGTDYTSALILADLDDDGALDIVTGNGDQINVAYLNDGQGSFAGADDAFSTGHVDVLTIGDMEGDGDLDLVVGGHLVDEPIHTGCSLYLNDGAGLLTPRRFAPGGAYSTAVGDVDGDGDLDVVVGDDGPNRIYLNDGAANFYTGTVDCSAPPPDVRCFGGETDQTWHVVLGDIDGDDDLDIVAGNGLRYGEVGQANALYLNDGAGNFGPGQVVGTGPDLTLGLALGDVDGDGDLDLVVGNLGQPNVLYRNDGQGGFSAGYPVGTGDDLTLSVALGDVDGDGDLDLVVGNELQGNVVYINDGGFAEGRPFGTGLDPTTDVVLGDVDGDGDLDLVTGNGGLFEVGQPNAVYLNDGAGGFDQSTPFRDFGGYRWTVDVAAGDLDGDGILELVSANSGFWPNEPSLTCPNRIRRPERLANRPPYLSIAHPGSVPAAEGYASPETLASTTIPITCTLFDPEGDPVRSIQAYYSPDGGGRWLPAAATSDTITTNLAASPSGVGHVFTWDTFASGLFGRSDNVVFRIEAYPGLQPSTDAVPGPYQWPYAAATTLPFRVRGTQVRVFSGTAPVSNALVYRLPAGQSWGEPIADTAGRPFRTDGQGYLQGRGQIEPGDRLVALLPITATQTYTLYHTSAAPTAQGLDPYTVTHPGVQTTTVSPDNPLVLFNLDVSLEWDARNDEQFMARLVFDLERASHYLYDWTNGQAALGEVTVYHDRAHWLDAHVRVYGSNRVRPSAAQGGIISGTLTDTLVPTVTYGAGQVHMGAVWNRYGDPGGGGGGEDWPRTLAHELGHFALFLDDNYIGLDEEGLLVPVEGCPGAMSDPYREDYPYDEFHPAAGWLPACERTLSHQLTGRSDWETIQLYYPWLAAYGGITNTGPAGLALAVTEVTVEEPVTPTDTLEEPTFYLVEEGGRVEPGPRARAVLFEEEGWVEDLGRPVLDYVEARGAREGDRLCVYELAAGRLGCEEIREGDELLELFALPGWQPEVLVQPVSSRTIALTVTNVPGGLDLWARLYPVSDPAGGAVALNETGGAYAGVLVAEEPALAGYVHVWVEEGEPRREVFSDYAMGGNPGYIRGRGGYMRGRGGYIRGRGAPAMSADGQAILFGEGLTFAPGEFYALQAATVLPAELPWATVVGQGYRLLASPGAPALAGTSISLGYMGEEVPAGEEEWMRVYYWGGEVWERLPTELDRYHNHAAAPVRGEGLYVLMSSIEVPLAEGWNLLSYPVAETRGVTETLLSISGSYGLVYGYDRGDPADPWNVYGVEAPRWVNDLAAFQFARGYWISATEAVTLYLKGAGEYALRAAVPVPPATSYGPVRGSAYFTPAVGMTVTAWVEGQRCGQASTLEVGGDVVYVVAVPADDEVAGCGARGRAVRFTVGGQVLSPTVPWDNGRLREVALRPIAPPEAHDDAAVTTAEVPLLVDVLANDSDPDGDVLAVVEVGLPLSGTAAISGTMVLYEPMPAFSGHDVFTYTAGDGTLVDTATVTVTVMPVEGPDYVIYLPLVMSQFEGRR